MSKSLVLGANGFIGSHLVDALANRGDEVVAFGRFKGETMFAVKPNITKFYGDFLNESDLDNALKGIDYVYHFISTTTPAAAENNPTIDIETNVRMSVELFNLCVKHGVKRVFFASTGGSVYGSNPNPPYSEEDSALPYSPYAIGKLSIEHYLRYFKKKHGLDSVTFRISNPYGERQPFHRKQGVIPIFIESICRNEPVTVYGDGTMVRDFVYVKDVARMIADVGVGSFEHDLYNIGSGEGVSVNTILETVERVTGREAKIVHAETPTTFVHAAVLNTERFKSEFDSAPGITLEEGIERTYNYIKGHIYDGEV